MSGWDKSIIGKKFNRLTILEFAGLNKHKKATFKCQCECGNMGVYLGTEVKHGHTKSCGCYNKDRKTKHGLYNTNEYQTYQDMLQRCYNKNNPYFKDYGERGIKVCKRWADKKRGLINFYADMGKRPKGKFSLGRIDNGKGYCPSNCRWETDIQQNRNLRTNYIITYKGERKCLAEWCEIYNINKSTLRHRLSKGWDIETALKLPLRKPKQYNYKGKEASLSELSKMFNHKTDIVRGRLDKGWSLENALETPQLYTRKNNS